MQRGTTVTRPTSAAPQAPNNLSSDVNYFCHICAVDVVGNVNTTSLEVECSNCRCNFVEALGQGLENFLNPPNNQSQPTTYSSRNGRVELTDLAAVPRRVQRNAYGNIRSSSNTPGYNDIPALMGMNDVAQVQRVSRGGRISAVHGSFPNNRAGVAGLDSLMSALLGSPSGVGPIFVGGPMGPVGMGVAMGAGNVRSFEDLLHHIMMNENSHAGVPPAADVMIESLTREVVTPDTNIQQLGECCISMEAFEQGDVAISLPCGHSYKQEPIVQWLRMHNTCPVCRVQLPSLDDDDEHGHSHGHSHRHRHDHRHIEEIN